jgi:hypothetical protein
MKKAFTLVELCIILVVFFILSCIALPIFMRQRQKHVDGQTKYSNDPDYKVYLVWQKVTPNSSYVTYEEWKTLKSAGLIRYQ